MEKMVRRLLNMIMIVSLLGGLLLGSSKMIVEASIAESELLSTKEQEESIQLGQLTSESVNVQAEIDQLLDYYQNNIYPLKYGYEFWAISLANLGVDTSESYVESVKKELNENSRALSGLNAQKIVIALSLFGHDATEFYFEEQNLIEYIIANIKLESSLINALSYTLMAIDSGKYEVPEDYREQLISYILDQELDQGGWNLFGSETDADITSMAITALEPYRDRDDVKRSVTKAINYLSEKQDETGGYYNKWNGGDSSGSVSQVIIGLSANGISPTSKEFTSIEGGHLLNHLVKFKRENGGYAHIIDDVDSNGMASEQAILAWAAYNNYLNGAGSVYQSQYDFGSVPDPEPKPEEPEIDLTILEELIKKAEGYTNEDNQYTEESFLRLSEAIDTAKISLGNIKTSEELSVAVENLQMAIDELEEFEEPEKSDGSGISQNNQTNEDSLERETSEEEIEEERESDNELPKTGLTPVFIYIISGATSISLGIGLSKHHRK